MSLQLLRKKFSGNFYEEKIHFGMTEVGTRGIATADDNLNHHRGRSRGGTRGGGAAFTL